MQRYLLLLLLLAGCGAPRQSEVAAIFDVPYLLDKPIPSLRKALGRPSVDTEPTEGDGKAEIKEWHKAWSRGMLTLEVTYRPADGQATAFLLKTDDPSGATNDTSRLLALGGIREGDARYKVEFVEAKSGSGKYAGVKVIPTSVPTAAPVVTPGSTPTGGATGAPAIAPTVAPLIAPTIAPAG
jgi:hypothetical protein